MATKTKTKVPQAAAIYCRISVDKHKDDEEKKELHYQLGSILEKMGKAQEAIEQFKIIYEADISYKDVAAKVDRYYSGQG